MGKILVLIIYNVLCSGFSCLFCHCFNKCYKGEKFYMTQINAVLGHFNAGGGVGESHTPQSLKSFELVGKYVSK